MRRPASLTALLAGVLALAACASVPRGPDMLSPGYPRALPNDGRVEIHWANPADFTEIRDSPNRYAAARGPWFLDLMRYMRQRAEAILPPGETLDLTVLDIDRAGGYEPWHGPAAQDIRYMRDIYPPRMTVRFVLRAADGKVLAEGERKLVDPGYLLGASPISDSDPLRYEKRMVDDWLRREFGARR